MTAFLEPNAPISGWARVPSESLPAVLDSLYWESLARELGTIILSLKHLRDLPPIPEEENVANRTPSEAAYFAAAWSPLDLNGEEATAVWECAVADMTERQRQELQYRRARMILAGLGLLDVKRLIEFRDAPLKSLEGKVQVNIVQIPTAANEPNILVHTVGCCECRRPIRSYFFNCNEGCIHHDKDRQSFCAFAKHQYKVCVHCYQESKHVKQHLKKIRPYDPLVDNITEGMDSATIKRLAKSVKRLQDHEDKREAKADGQDALRILLHSAPEMAKKRMLPFGNVHASVMFGPLVFEIGAPHSQGGALVSHRQTPDLAYSENWKFIDSEITTPAVAVSPDKNIFTRVRKSAPRSIHSVTMQVMGGLFSGHNPNWREIEHKVVESLLTESYQYWEKPGKSQKYNDRRLREAASRIASVIKDALDDEVAAYLRHFSARLSDPNVDLKLDRLKLRNNCQRFCKNLVYSPGGFFETVLPRLRPLDTATNPTPRYMLSFASDRIGSMFDSEVFHTTPSAAYLSEFHTGEDIVEYFDTWPHIPRTNACAKLLCWPCLNNSGCSLAQHMWQMPHETTSLIAFHILRERTSYQHAYVTDDPKEDEPSLLTDTEWFENRLRVLVALDTFLVSAGAIAASYQMIAAAGNDESISRPWKSPPVAELGALILPGNKEQGTQNFTIQKAGKWILPVWFSKDWKMEKHLKKTTTRQSRSGPEAMGD